MLVILSDLLCLNIMIKMLIIKKKKRGEKQKLQLDSSNSR